MPIQNLFSSRDNAANSLTYVGQQGRVWFDLDSNTFYVSDGITPGGIAIGGGTSGYGNSNVANYLTEYTGNIAAGNITVTGNIYGNLVGNTNFANLTGNYIYANKFGVNLTAGETVTTGQIAWNATDRTFDMGMVNGSVLQVGQEEYIVVKAGENITNGQTVMFGGATGENIIGLVCNVAIPGFRSEHFIGVATDSIAQGSQGYITVFGKVRNLNTNAYSPGDILWQSTTVPGAFTTVEPDAPGPKIAVAAVTKRSSGDGHIMVRPTPAPLLHGLSDVYANVANATSNQYLLHDTNGWYAANLRIVHDTSPSLGGNLNGNNHAISNVSTISIKTTTVNSLPNAVTVGAGAKCFVTDADSRTFGNLAVGGAGNGMPVFSDGTNWYIG